MSLDHKGFSARKADILKYIEIYDNTNHKAVAHTLLATTYRELNSIVKELKKQGKYFESKTCKKS